MHLKKLKKEKTIQPLSEPVRIVLYHQSKITMNFTKILVCIEAVLQKLIKIL